MAESLGMPKRLPAGKYSRVMVHLQRYRSGQQDKFREKESYWGNVDYVTGSVRLRERLIDVLKTGDRLRDYQTGDVFQVNKGGISAEEYETRLTCTRITGETLEGGETTTEQP
jgi:hypothetical protein